MESPQWVPPSAQRSQGRGTLGTERVKREGVGENGAGARGGTRFCHHMGQIKPQLADFMCPSPPTLPIHPSVPMNFLASVICPLSEATEQRRS
ncbi:hypothetical protein CgunFtcFv8_019944 [Champsocephalus gunnari]|uniref:Uncharacterized protein n=1 Tax=Champsocephalus gunnari TaxID=52237 RepID=A0AAN8HP40_CHAGU|nr:hypothetical protein CgunFtcFv8_019944 [Champsocephalus gunnari]